MPGRFFLTVFISAALAAAIPLWAGEDGKAGSSTELAFTVSSVPEAQLAFTQAWTFPALQGSGFLTSGNNLRTALSYNVTPVSMNAGLDLTLTPIAFAQLKAGGSLGTGWNCAFLDIAPHAWGLNRQQPDGGGLIGGEPFEAAIWALYGGAVLQFDLGAVIPGDWNHVLFQTDHQINYRANTLAGAGDAWSHENDGGENRNGFNYYGVYVLGYQMPAFPVLKTIAFMAEMKLKLYAEQDSPYGDDLSWWFFSGLANFEINSWFSIAAIVQFSLERNFDNWHHGSGTGKDVFYTRRVLNKDDPRYLDFYRVAAIFSFKLR
jgi:hypothetical protein